MQLEPLDTHLWHAAHAFKANGLPITTRMTVVQLPGRKLLIHSPIPMPPGGALLRQVPQAVAEESAPRFGPLTVDLAYRRVTLAGEEVALTRKEYALLAQLARHPGRVITQQQLLKDIWGPTHAEDTHYLRIVVGHLRQKLGDDPTAPRFIITEAGVGYRLVAPTA